MKTSVLGCMKKSLPLNLVFAAVTATALNTGQVLAADAQRLSPSQLENLVKQSGNKPEGGGAVKSSAVVASASLVTGWNTRQCAYSVLTTGGNTYYVFAFNTDGTYVYASSNVSYLTSKQAVLIDVCRASSTYWVFITDAGSGAWSTLQTK